MTTPLRDGTLSPSQNATTDERYAAIVAAIEKQADRNNTESEAHFRGAYVANTICGDNARKYPRLGFQIEIVAEGALPNVDAQFKVRMAGAALSEIYTLPSATRRALIPVTGDGDGGAGAGIAVDSDEVQDVIALNTSGAEDVVVRVHAIKYIED